MRFGLPVRLNDPIANRVLDAMTALQNQRAPLFQSAGHVVKEARRQALGAQARHLVGVRGIRPGQERAGFGLIGRQHNALAHEVLSERSTRGAAHQLFTAARREHRIDDHPQLGDQLACAPHNIRSHAHRRFARQQSKLDRAHALAPLAQQEQRLARPNRWHHRTQALDAPAGLFRPRGHNRQGLDAKGFGRLAVCVDARPLQNSVLFAVARVVPGDDEQLGFRQAGGPRKSSRRLCSCRRRA